MWPRLRRFDRDVGTVLAAFIVLLAVENVVVGFGYRAEFVGTWEMGSARLNLSPIALAASLPLAMVCVLIGYAAASNRPWPVTIGAALGGVALGVGVSTGRRVSILALRIPFVGVVALGAAVVTWVLVTQLRTRRKRTVVGLGVVVTTLAWLADAFVLRRLYPAFHIALLIIAVVAWSATALVLDRSKARGPVALVAIVVTGASIAWTPYAASRVHGHDNLRRVLLAHAPILGRATLLAAEISPPPAIDDDDGAASATLTSLRRRAKDAQALDWTGRDIFLITIDALRADHLSSYGYSRATSPNIDALAARGVRFEHAYCPTPHTSYSITSMMTGTYMKPLLSIADEASAGETWAVQLRRYGYRTAAFYPPAVFFIDEHRFHKLHEANLGFEYFKEEFATPVLRQAQIDRYLAAAPKDRPVFLWVHLFEPHEPYEMHPEHEFSGDPKVDAYDSEIATADAFVGAMAKIVREHRPESAVIILSADHGEEHGDHGGRYHGTTVYEEQVRVPLVIVANDLAPKVVSEPVQTIDLLPTTLAALDIPIPPRLRGRDLGPTLRDGQDNRGDTKKEGLAFAETDDDTLLARGDDRLICQRKVGACTLFDVKSDPGEKTPVTTRPDRVTELRKLTAAIERETGRLSSSEIPEALRRGLQGDRDAAEDVAPLLDDARVDIRRLAARCAFQIRAPELTTQLRRALERDEDTEVRRWAAIALLRIEDGKSAVPSEASSLIDAVLKSSEPRELDLREAAALAMVERGDVRGEPVLLARWSRLFGRNVASRGELDDAREMLTAFAKAKSKVAAPVLAGSLEDVRIRPHLVAALAEIGDARAKEPLLRTFAAERYVHLRSLEARTLVKLGAKNELLAPLARFAGTPEPLTDAILIARDAHVLIADKGGREWSTVTNPKAPLSADARVKFLNGGRARLIVLTEPPEHGGEGPTVTVSLLGTVLPQAPPMPDQPAVTILDVPFELKPGDVQLNVKSRLGTRAIWLVARAPDIPPPPPEAWVPRPGTEDPEIAPDAGL